MIHVRRTSNAQLSGHGLWGGYKGSVYITCNNEGLIDWKTADVYSLAELLKRGKTILI
jgi:hypothetical protein